MEGDSGDASPAPRRRNKAGIQVFRFGNLQAALLAHFGVNLV
ncbi:MULTISPECIES: hypothetical protein [Burkholderia]|uniref:Uncharacterized protein n=1 Tax=Burkholderia pyrrocinia TaxID=60550 RepID=A0A318HWB8_BURPY|nr:MULTISPECIES: hypothetical protein [Burkholderia]PXX22533.1 hypothetical protein NA66_10396 [Burkholderia pyrrocinia]SFW46917.1 hypothetical protein SAMN03159384_02221 [Burkholderia sp. NFACC33-1]SFY04585.1 hypothetical protein SAMN03159408_03025 [Burkholderia sp. NFPP32]